MSDRNNISLRAVQYWEALNTNPNGHGGYRHPTTGEMSHVIMNSMTYTFGREAAMAAIDAAITKKEKETT